MRRFGEGFFRISAFNSRANVEEAMRRMEAGEDPDTIEAEMGDLLDNDDMLFGPGKSGLKGMTRRLRPPEVDEKLYDL